MKQWSSAEVESFITEKSVAAIHFDAEWDVGYRLVVREKMFEAAKTLKELANFGEVDVDQNQGMAKSIRLLNVPAVAYYRDGKLVTLTIGAAQDIRARIERLLRGESIT